MLEFERLAMNYKEILFRSLSFVLGFIIVLNFILVTRFLSGLAAEYILKVIDSCHQRRK